MTVNFRLALKDRLQNIARIALFLFHYEILDIGAWLFELMRWDEKKDEF